MPFTIEEIFRSADCQGNFNWTLVDNCLYTKELAESIRNSTSLSNRWLSQRHLDEWHEDNISPRKKERLFLEKVGQYHLPPSNLTEFEAYWFRLAIFHRIPKPNMVMFESLQEVKDKKFDLVHFDLAAGAYEVNRDTFEYLINNSLSDDGIVVFDDMTPKHPNMLILLQSILTTTSFRPIAFSTGKIAMMRKQYKNSFIDAAYKAGLMEDLNKVSTLPDEYYSFQRCGGSESNWGDFLDIRAN
jgi:hypothetical protein